MHPIEAATLRRHAVRSFAMALAGALLGVLGATGSARADSWFLEPELTTMVTETNDSRLVSDALAKRDTIVNLEPSLRARGQGAHYLFDGYFALNGVAYLHGTEISHVLPNGALNLNADAYERHVLLDTGLSSTQVAVNPFAATPAGLGTSTSNVYTSTQYHFNPALSANLAPGVAAIARSENAWNAFSGLSATGVQTSPGRYDRQSLALVDSPAPFGWGAAFARAETKFTDQNEAAVVDTSARLNVDYILSSQWLASVIAGHETARVQGLRLSDPLYGLHGAWRPSDRTDLDIEVDHRYFGTGWAATWDHRLPHVTLLVRWTRDATTFPQSSLSPTLANLGSLVETSLTSTVTDANERAQQAQNFLAQYGLPNLLPGANTTFTEQVQIVDSINGTVLWILNPRDSVTFSAYRSRYADFRPQGQIVANGTSAANNIQTGGTAILSHRLTPHATLNLTLLRSMTDGLGANATRAAQDSVRIEWIDQIGPRTSGLIGLRHQAFNTTSGSPTRETAVYAGLTQRF